MLISDSPNLNTGYGVVSHNLGKQLRRMGHDIAFIGFTAAGKETYHKLDNETVPLYEGNTTVSIMKAFEEWRPELGIHIRDAFAHSPRHHTNPYSIVSIPNRPKIVLYTPVQADNLPDEFVSACIRECDLCVSFTRWGYDVLQFQGVPSNRMEWIHCGFDEEIFRPIEVRKEEYGFLPNRKLIGSIGVSDQYRKGWPLLLQAAAKLKKSYPDFELFLGTSPQGHYDLLHHANKMGLKGIVSYPQVYLKSWGVPFERMAEIYNCFDVYCTTTIAEGFNLPALEAFACGVPAVLTDLPNHREILGDGAFYVPSTKTYPTGWSFEWLADSLKAAEILRKVLSMSDAEKSKLRESQLKHAKNRTWKLAAEKWVEVIAKHKELGVKV